MNAQLNWANRFLKTGVLVHNHNTRIEVSSTRYEDHKDYNNPLKTQ